VEVNLEETPLAHYATASVRGAAGLTLPTVLGLALTPCGTSTHG
jgi:hypothetical protein